MFTGKYNNKPHEHEIFFYPCRTGNEHKIKSQKHTHTKKYNTKSKQFKIQPYCSLILLCLVVSTITKMYYTTVGFLFCFFFLLYKL